MAFLRVTDVYDNNEFLIALDHVAVVSRVKEGDKVVDGSAITMSDGSVIMVREHYLTMISTIADHAKVV